MKRVKQPPARGAPLCSAFHHTVPSAHGESNVDPEPASRWQPGADLCTTLEQARTQLRDPFSGSPADLRSTSATCCASSPRASRPRRARRPGHPEFTRMLDLNRRWGWIAGSPLPVRDDRGDNAYRISGDAGSANLLDIRGMPGTSRSRRRCTKTISSTTGTSCAGADGSLCFSRREKQPGNGYRWPRGRFVQCEGVCRLGARATGRAIIERLGGPVLRPRLDAERSASASTCCEAGSSGGALWRDIASDAGAAPNSSGYRRSPEQRPRRPARGGYGMGNFSCGPGEAGSSSAGRRAAALERVARNWWWKRSTSARVSPR